MPTAALFQSHIKTPPLVNPPATGAKFPGHIPNRVLVGQATPQEGSNVDPGWDESRTLIGQPIYEARRFVGDWVSTTDFNGMVAQADAASALPFISFKVPGGSTGSGWADVANGGQDAGLLSLFNLCVGYGDPLLVSFEHEPAGSSVTDADLAQWARMQTYCCWYFAGRRGGTASSPYVAAHDISLNNGGNVGWAPCGNGFWWRSMSNTALAANRAAAWPASLISALNTNKGIATNDFYDADYADQTGALTNEALRVPGTGVRTSVRISNYITWARQNGVNASGCGEYGVIDGAEMTACWNVMRANRDVWCLSNYFNSQNNSDHEWRIIPSTYPDGNPTGSKGLVDFGGNAQSQGRLDAFKTTLTQSISATYTAPL